MSRRFTAMLPILLAAPWAAARAAPTHDAPTAPEADAHEAPAADDGGARGTGPALTAPADADADADESPGRWCKRGLWYFALVWENDSRLPNWLAPAYDVDRFYTGGLGVLFSLPPSMGQVTFPGARGAAAAQGQSVGAIMVSGYTPEDLTVPHVIPDDRPYASLLAFELQTTYEVAVSEGPRRWNEARWTVGGLGMSIVPWVQPRIHDHLRAQNDRRIAAEHPNTRPPGYPPDPKGWHNQIPLEPWLSYSRGTFAEMPLVQISDRWTLADFWLHTLASVGSDTSMTADLTLRIGRMPAGPYISVPGQRATRMQKAHGLPPGPPAQPAQGEPPPADEGLDWGAFFFASAGPQVVLWNSTLHGQFRSAPHRLTLAETRRLQALGSYGFALRLGALSVGASATFRSPDLRVGAQNPHAWESIWLEVSGAPWRRGAPR